MSAFNYLAVLVNLLGFIFCWVVARSEWRRGRDWHGWAVATIWASSCLINAIGDLM